MKNQSAQTSKCWTCKYGLCMRESQIETFLSGLVEEEKEGFLASDFSEDNVPQEGKTLSVEHVNIKTVCFWRPEGIQNSPPILLSMVQECNRYRKQ